VTAEAQNAAFEIRAGYRSRETGDLESHVFVVNADAGRYGAGMEVKSTAKHAWIFENGSEARHYITKKGRRHATGAMWGRRPGGHVFIPAMARARFRMWTSLAALLVRHGLKVSGHAT
jgi:hypothetical protein